MSKTDLDLLCADASPEEVKRLMRLAREWSQGDEHSFPVQLALLTRSQWRAAASIPRLVNDSRKGLELHLAEYCEQTAALTGNLEQVGREQVAALREIIEGHRAAVAKIEQQGHQREARLEAVANHIKTNLESAELSWRHTRAQFESERQKLEQAREDLDSRQNWRDWLVYGGLVFAALVVGIAVGLSMRK